MKKVLVIVAAGLVVAGCGASRKAATSGKSEKEIRPTERPAGETQRRDHRGEENKTAPARPVRPPMSFSGLQTEHVRIAADRYTVGTVTAFDLDRLAREFRYPYHGQFLSDYGMRGRAMHTGVDIRTIPNDTIRAAFPGVVRMSKNYSSYGNIVVVRHYEGFETVYAHCSSNLVSVNDAVEPGDPIGLGGRTGRATTEHLHFEIRVGSEPVDPNLFIDFQREKMREGNVYVQHSGDRAIAATTPEGLAAAEQVAAYDREQAQRERAEVDAQIAAKQPEKPKAEYHTVKQGDTLSAIARRYKTTVRKLCELNNIRETSTLRINQRLRVK